MYKIGQCDLSNLNQGLENC